MSKIIVVLILVFSSWAFSQKDPARSALKLIVDEIKEEGTYTATKSAGNEIRAQLGVFEYLEKDDVKLVKYFSAKFKPLIFDIEKSRVIQSSQFDKDKNSSLKSVIWDLPQKIGVYRFILNIEDGQFSLLSMPV